MMTSLSNIAGGLIRRAVGNNLENDEQDVLSVKTALVDLGRFEKEEKPHGIITRELDSAIKSFQREKGLHIDGRIRPSGETEAAIKKEQENQQGERERQEEKRKKCVQFSDDLRIARIRLEGIDKELTEAIKQVNMTLKVWQKAHEEYIRRNAESAMKTASSVDRGVLGAAGFASTLINEIPEVEAAKKKAEEAEERHQSAQNHEAYLQREKKERYGEVERIQKEIEKTGCR